MTPMLFVANIGDAGTAHTKHFCNHMMCFVLGKLSDFNDVAFGEFCKMVSTSLLWRKASINGMETVFTCCHPLQVFQTVVKFVAVFMVHLWFVVGVWQKVLSNKPMDSNGFAPTVFLYANVPVCRFTDAGFQDSLKTAFEAFNPSKIGDLIAFKSFDVCPNFIHNVTKLRIK